MVLTAYMIHYHTYITPNTHVFLGNSALLLVSLLFMGIVYSEHAQRFYIYGCLLGLFAGIEMYFYYYKTPNDVIVEDDLVTAFILLCWVGLVSCMYSDSRVRALAIIVSIATVLTLHYVVPMYNQKIFDHVLYMGVLWLWMLLAVYNHQL